MRIVSERMTFSLPSIARRVSFSHQSEILGYIGDGVGVFRGPSLNVAEQSFQVAHVSGLVQDRFERGLVEAIEFR
jgi:hypothetical protein